MRARSTRDLEAAHRPGRLHDALSDDVAAAYRAAGHWRDETLGDVACRASPGDVLLVAEIRRHLERAGLARQRFPEHLVLVDDLPRVPSGKGSKDVLRARVKEIAAAEDASRAEEGRA